MELKNGYKLIYAKLDGEGVRHLYASKKDIPTAEDVVLTYGEVSEEEAKALKLVYVAAGKLLGSVSGLPTAEDKELVVKAGDEVVLG